MKSNKELKAEYKQMTFKMGVYQIRNKVDNKILLGSSNNLDAIWNRHRFTLNMGSHRNKALQDDWKLHGEDQFIYEILEEIDQEDDSLDYTKELETLEEMYRDELQPFHPKGYNKKPKR